LSVGNDRPRRTLARLVGAFLALQLCLPAAAQTRVPGGEPIPLPQRRPPGLTPPVQSEPPTPVREPERPAGPPACFGEFARRGGLALPPPPQTSVEGCAIEDPVTFRSIAMPDGSKVELDSAVTLRCVFALEVLAWVRDDIGAALASETAKLAAITSVGGHECRSRNRVVGAFLSEHATGNALDLGGLRLGDGRKIGLTNADGATRALRETLHKSACARFMTVLGPGSDSAHKDHIHLDLRQRKRDFKMCQWSLD